MGGYALHPFFFFKYPSQYKHFFFSHIGIEPINPKYMYLTSTLCVWVGGGGGGVDMGQTQSLHNFLSGRSENV